MPHAFLRATAGTAVVVAIAALALPAAAQSPSTPASPAAVTSTAPGASLGAAPSGYSWTTLAQPAGTEEDYLTASGVAADGTWAAIAWDPDSEGPMEILHLGPTDTAIGLTTIPKSAGDDPGTLIRVGDQLLAIGSGKVWTSPDGSAWTPTKAKLKGLFMGSNVAGSGTPALIVTSAPRSRDLVVLSTTDGTAFTRATVKAPEGRSGALFTGLSDARVAVSPTGTVVVLASDLDYEKAHVWSSTDGVTFTPGTLPSDAQQQYTEIEGLAATPSGFIMFVNENMHGGAAAYTSPDGLAWTETPTYGAPDSVVTLPASSGGGMLMTGNGVLYTSPDGVSWTSTPTPELEGLVNVTTAAALPDGRIILGVLASDDTADRGFAPAVLVGTPQP